MSIDPARELFDRAQRAGIAMSAICARSGVAKSTPSRWRNGKVGVTYGTLQKLNRSLDALIAEKYGDEDHDGTGSQDPSPPSSGKCEAFSHEVTA